MEKRRKKSGGGWLKRIRRKELENPFLSKPTGMVRPPLVEREIRFLRFREALGKERLESFIEYLRREKQIYPCIDLDEKMGRRDDLAWLVLTADIAGFVFDFRKFTRNRWLLDFGFYAGPLTGEYAQWLVKFDEDGKIAQIRLWRESIS